MKAPQRPYNFEYYTGDIRILSILGESYAKV